MNSVKHVKVFVSFFIYFGDATPFRKRGCGVRVLTRVLNKFV
jgi:hypothetical protein